MRLDLKPHELRRGHRQRADARHSDLHAELSASFDWDHRDPWDRILAAQTRLEHCAFVSTDVLFDAIIHERGW